MVGDRAMGMACWLPVRKKYSQATSACRHLKGALEVGDEDTLLWSRDLEKHHLGEFSFAVVQANDVIEDHSQVDAGRLGTFVGVYDGHGGADAARYVSEHLLRHLIKTAKDGGGRISEDVIKSAVSDTENGFLTRVQRTYVTKPSMAAVGTCCLAGIFWNGTLFIANVGDSRAVMGHMGKSKNIVAEQLTKDHNTGVPEVRQELKALHPNDPSILLMKQGVWRIKGLIQVSRSIGDAYLKKPEYSRNPSQFNLPEPIRQPVLSSQPYLLSRAFQPTDRFVIFASDGLWEHLTNQQVVDIVHANPRVGIAKRLITAALEIAARKREMRYSEVVKLGKGVRRYIHDDITVAVVFIDEKGNGCDHSGLSVRGFVDRDGPSRFDTLQG